MWVTRHAGVSLVYERRTTSACEWLTLAGSGSAASVESMATWEAGARSCRVELVEDLNGCDVDRGVCGCSSSLDAVAATGFAQDTANRRQPHNGCVAQLAVHKRMLCDRQLDADDRFVPN